MKKSTANAKERFPKRFIYQDYIPEIREMSTPKNA